MRASRCTGYISGVQLVLEPHQVRFDEGGGADLIISLHVGRYLGGQRLKGSVFGWADYTGAQHAVAPGIYALPFENLSSYFLQHVEVHGSVFSLVYVVLNGARLEPH